MKGLLLSLILVCSLVFSYFYKFEIGRVDTSSFNTKLGSVAEIIHEAQNLNSDEFGYKQLMGYFDGVIPVDEMVIVDVFLKRSLFDMVFGVECYEVFLMHNNRTVMFVSLTIDDGILNVGSAAFVYSDPH